MRTIFWGTPEFAAPALRALIGEGHEVVGVVTQPDRPRGRSRSQLVASPVKDIAIAEEIPVLQPERPRGAEVLAVLRTLEADISVVVAYGRLLPREVIDLPPRGTINIHGSLLPLLRGASPIEGAILAGMTETGVSIMRMVLAMDAGPVLLRSRTLIGADETGGELRQRLAEMGAESLIEVMAMIETGTEREEPQDAALATRVGLITRDDARVDWRAPGPQVSRVVRAYDPKPGAFSTRGGVEVKIFGGAESEGSGAAGTVLDIDDGGMRIACGTGAIRVTAVHPAGRKRLSPREWAAGRGMAVGPSRYKWRFAARLTIAQLKWSCRRSTRMNGPLRIVWRVGASEGFAALRY